MPIAINGSGSITGISAGGLPDGVITNPDLAADAVSRSKLDADTATGVCKAWVNFNGNGTVAIRASYNVSSITDNGVGDYTVNFTTAMADGNYASCVNSGNNAGGGQGSWTTAFSVAASTSSSLRVTAFSTGGSYQDQDQVMFAIFR